jgi:hypothetical protein
MFCGVRGRASKFFPLADFFVCVFERFSIRGAQQRDKKNHDIARASKPIQGRIKYVRTLFFFFIFFFCRPLADSRPPAAQRTKLMDMMGLGNSDQLRDHIR